MAGQLGFYKGARKDNWQTPPGLWKRIDKLYRFTWDLAADWDNAKCENYLDAYTNSLGVDWGSLKGTHWLNPPFSKAKEFFEKAAFQQNPMVAIYKAANPETATWQEYIFKRADWVLFIAGRVNYVNAEGALLNGVPFGSALIGYRVKPHERLRGFGALLIL